MTDSRDEPTPRQVLYGLVAAGFLVVAGVLTAGAAAAGIGPVWWAMAMATALIAASVWSIRNWRRTVPCLAISIGLFLTWTVGTLILA
jgi:hypothetical protein